MSLATALLAPLSRADAAAEAAALIDGYIDGWVAFYPSRAFAYGHAASAASFENPREERVEAWLDLNLRTDAAASELLEDRALDLAMRTDLAVLRGQARDELAEWAEDEPLTRQPQWYAERISQALTHLLVRDQLSAPARYDAALARLVGVARLSELAVAKLEGGNALRTQRALRTLAGTRAFYAGELAALLDGLRAGGATMDAAGAPVSEETAVAVAMAVEAIAGLEARLDAMLPALSEDPSIGSAPYTAKLDRRHGGALTPGELARDSRDEMHRVRRLMLVEARRWYGEQAASRGVLPDDLPEGETLLEQALEAMEADRRTERADFREQFTTLTFAAEAFVEEKAIATVPKPTTLFVDLSPAHFSGAAVGGVYPSGPFDPEADTLFYLPSIPDSAPAAAREGFYRSFNDHFNAMIISHEMFPGHYLQYKVAVSEAPAVRSLFSSGAYTEGWGSFVEEIMLDRGWADNAPLTRLAHLRKRLENATRAHVSVQVHTAGWRRDEVLRFAVDEGLLAPQFAENLWQRVVNSPMQITDYFVGYRQFVALFARRDPERPLRHWVDAVLEAGPVPMELLPPLIAADR